MCYSAEGEQDRQGLSSPGGDIQLKEESATG